MCRVSRQYDIRAVVFFVMRMDWRYIVCSYRGNLELGREQALYSRRDGPSG